MYKKYKTLGIIPARGDSKGIPGKNIVNLGGKPLIAHAIQAMQESGVVDRIIVTTDDQEIARVAQQYGAEVPFLRPSELAQDDTPTIPVIIHALEWIEKNEKCILEHVLLIQPTEPFVQSQHIQEVLSLMIEKKADSGITTVAIPRTHHPYHVRNVTENGYLEFVDEKLHYTHTNRQADPKRLAFGNLYWFKRDIFLKEKKIEVGKRIGVEIDPIYAHDINEPFDLEIAQLLIKKLK